MPRLAWAALASAALGLILFFSPPAPLPYLGGLLLIVAPVLAIAAFVRSRRPLTAAAVIVVAIPLAFMAWVFYWLATEAS